MPTEKLYYFRYEVTGRGNFPLDMLRRDMCYPYDTDSVINIDSEEYVERTVVLCHWDARRHWTPNTERWESFGWKVTKLIEG